MKKYAKILSAVLVIAALCASLIFTVGADEGEPFESSIKITDFAGNSISSGDSLAMSTVEGNRATAIETLNPGHSPAISLAKGEGSNAYIVAYANKTYSGTSSSGSNLGISVGTDKSAPFAVVGDKVQGYYVIDFDIASHGNMLPGIDISVVMRRESDSSGYPFSDEVFIGGYVTETDEWSHVTLVGDLVNNVVKVYINGQFVSDAGVAVRTDSEEKADRLKNDTKVVALGYRVELTRNNQPVSVTAGDNVLFDNFAHRLYIENGADLSAALSDGDLTDWSGYTAGRAEELLPVVATVDGVEYRNFKNLTQAFSTNDTIAVEFLAKPLAPLSVCVNATFNTNGMAQNELFKVVDGCQIVSANGNIVKTTAPFVSNYSENPVDFSKMTVNSADIPEIYNATKGNAPGNLYNRFNMVTAASLSNIGKLGYRNSTIITDTLTGTSIYRESANVSAGSTTTTGQNEYSNFNFSKVNLKYEEGKNEYIVIDYDYTYTGTLDNYLALLIIPRGNSGYHAAGLKVAQIPVTEGEMVHITAVHDYTNNVAYYFINGVLTNTLSSGAISSSGHSAYLRGGEDIRVEEYKLGSNSLNTVYFANMNIRFFDLEESSDTISDAINSQDITCWNENIYTSDYKIAQFPAIVTVDGESYSDANKVGSVLYGNKKTPAVVKVLHPFDEVITVNCDATIYTYGQDVTFVDVNGKTLTPDKNGIIRLDIPYMPVRVEEQLAISGGSHLQAAYNAIKYNVTGNLFSSFVHSEGNWGAVGFRNASLITDLVSGDVVYRNFAMLNADGALSGDSAEYLDMRFTANTFKYSAGSNSYVVVDFDFATDRSLTDDVSVLLVSSTGVSANALVLKDLGILDGDMAHVTVVYDFTNDCAYAFVNGLYACSVSGGVLPENTDYLAGDSITVNSFRLSTEGKTSSVCFDNVAIRTFTYNVAEDTLAGVVDSGDITVWSSSIYDVDYSVSKLPVLAIVDGREYGSVDTLNKLLLIETNYVKSVELQYVPEDDVRIRTEAAIETNGLGIQLNWNTGLYEFDPGIERYRGTRTGLAYASTKFIYTTVGTKYTFQVINADNCWSNASISIWSYSMSKRNEEVKFHEYDVVFYPYGEKMSPIDDGTYIVDGKRVTINWKKIVITGSHSFERQDVVDYPIANPNEPLATYTTQTTPQNISFAATDMLYSANISTNIEFIFYVNKNQTITDTGKVVEINGKEYVAFVYELAPHEIDKVITVSFQVRSGETVLTQKQEICFVDYARTLLEGDYDEKALVASLLNYANEAHALFDDNGEKIPAVTALLEEYAQLLPNEALTAKIDTTALSSVIRSAHLRLNSTSDFVFKVARGFRGTVTMTYNSLGETVEYSVYVNALSSEQTIVLGGMCAYDIASDITITVLPYGADTPIVGTYNLATYAQVIEDNAFAVALYNYSKTALAYQSAAVNYVPVG